MTSRRSPRAVELRDGAGHPGRSEKARRQEVGDDSLALHRVPAGAAGHLFADDPVADDPRHDVRRPRGVVEDRPGCVVERERRGIAREARFGSAEQHLDAVGGGTVDVVLVEPETGTHLEELQQRDALLRCVRPLRHRCGGVGVEEPVDDEQPDGGVGDRLRHTPRQQGRLGGDLGGGLELVPGPSAVALGDHLAAADRDEGQRDPRRFVAGEQFVDDLGCSRPGHRADVSEPGRAAGWRSDESVRRVVRRAR